MSERAIFVKQYGARRTGTNALRWLVQKNIPQAEVLMHVLGDKHGAPARLVLRRDLADPRRAVDLVWEATLEVPSRTTDRNDPAQRAFIERNAASLLEALRTDALFYALSVKDPYAWLVSILKAEGWIPPRRLNGLRGPLPRKLWPRLRQVCSAFHHAYAAWFACVDANPDRWTIVRHEDLISRPSLVLKDLCKFIGVERGEETGPLLRGVVRPTHWDDEPCEEHVHPFDASYYVEHRYIHDLDAAGRNILEEEIDWEQWRPLGYQPLPHQLR